ncbi:MAG: hypothetical protein AVDCRST_MAG42-337, partial [uncultured Chthoniobacterales bacterium]
CRPKRRHPVEIRLALPRDPSTSVGMTTAARIPLQLHGSDCTS